jgi:hypothetical protein
MIVELPDGPSPNHVQPGMDLSKKPRVTCRAESWVFGCGSQETKCSLGAESVCLQIVFVRRPIFQYEKAVLAPAPTRRSAGDDDTAQPSMPIA